MSWKRIGLAAVIAAMAVSTARAAVVFEDLGTEAPPAHLGPFIVLPFSRVAQAAIPDGTLVTEIPGSPGRGTLTADVPLGKETVGFGWATWSHDYKGPVFANFSGNTVTLTTPHTRAFYAYVEPNNFDVFNVTVTTDDGGTSGPIPVQGFAGANGFGFYTTAGETIMTVTITVDPLAEGFAIAEFGSEGSVRPAPAVQPLGLLIVVLALVGLGVATVRRRGA